MDEDDHQILLSRILLNKNPLDSIRSFDRQVLDQTFSSLLVGRIFFVSR